MSLLDDVSIVVTPNGYKAGELYAVVPVPTEGAELVTNGDFTTDSDWNKTGTWSIENNYATANGNSTSQYIQQDFTITNAKIYLFTYEIIENTLNGNGASLSGSGGFVSVSLSSVIGTHQVYITADDSGAAYALKIGVSGTATTGTIKLDNVSVKEVTSADMDVTRATAATRVDEDGLVNYAEIIGSEEVTNGDFSGGSTGWTVIDSDADNYVVFDGSTARLKFLNTSPVTTFKTTDAILTGGKTYKLIVDIASVTSGMVKVDGNGISELFNTAGINTRIIQPTGNGSLGFYRATANVDLTFNSVSVKEVTRDNVPRIDYTGGGCPHILAEPQRTNIAEYSQNFTNGNFWNFQGVNQIDNSIISPDGTQNADKFYPLTTGSFKGLTKSFGSSLNAAAYNLSTFVKKGGKDFFFFYNIGSPQGSNGCWFNLSTGVIGTVGSAYTNVKIEDVGNDWFRCSATLNYGGTGDYVYLLMSDYNGSLTALVNGTDGIYLWGSQIEAGSYATSYIPTDGSTVTRNQDIFTRDGIGSLINSTEGVLFVEMAALSNDSTRKTISLSDGTNTNRVVLRYDNASNRVQGFIQVGGATNGNINDNSYTITNFLKIAYKWKAGDFALWINGTEVAVSTSATSFGSGVLTEMQFNEGDGAGFEYFGKVKQLQVYNTALTDEQLLQLTGTSGTDFYESYAEMASALTYTIQ